MKFKVLDLFCGAGGFSSGLDYIDNFETVLGTDFDPYSVETFENNFPKSKAILGDITQEEIKRKIIQTAKVLGVNLVIGGPPCQGFSKKGKSLGTKDPRNFLFMEYYEIVKELKPEIFVLENVKNIITAENGFFLNEIQEKFSKLGYMIDYGILNAKDFGVPQSRERAFIIGSLNRSIHLPKGDESEIVTVEDAISDLAYLESAEGQAVSKYLHAPLSDYQKTLRGELLYNHIATNHSKVALEKLAMIPPEGDKSSLPAYLHGRQKFSRTWSRLEWNKVSPTIDTRFDTPSNGKNSHPELNRAITPREAARLQSFSDSFVFYGPKSSIGKQIGNAVPPYLGRAIGNTINEVYNRKMIKNDQYEIYQDDACALIKEFIQKGKKVSHIITDPPYNISKEHHFDTLDNPRLGVDFGEWDKDFDLYSWIDDYVKILKSNGSFIIFCSYRYISHIIDRLELNDFEVKDVIIWKKLNPMPRNTERRYVQDSEFAVWAVKKSAKWVFHKPEGVSYIRPTYVTPIVNGNERTLHPTQKSLTLMEKLIQVHTNPNDIILDPFMGSGTTGVASIKNDRKFIGIEITSQYLEISKDRLEEYI